MNQAKIIFILTLFAAGCQSIKNEQVTGEEAIKRISKEISVVSVYEAIGGYGTNPARCNSIGTTSPPYGIGIDAEPNETYSTAQTIQAQYPQFPRMQVNGIISSPADKDVFQFTSPQTLSTKFTMLSGAAACKLSYGADESSNNSFIPFGVNFSLTPGLEIIFTIGPNPWEAVYIACEGTTAQSYTLQADYNAYENGASASSTTYSYSAGIVSLTTSHLFFIEAMGISKSKTYSGHSVDRCIDAIRTTGAVYAISSYNRSFSTCEINRGVYETGRITLLKEDCTLEPAKITANKIYGTGE
ncbi:hypothetical protein DLM76_00805 [Leptospira yasudae]|uniref:hypothetical protein n=1 Tax=Leptospira yasudae TaxID=2202201 RepID=UPI000E59C859|nr:hypothetical protein [Leptospira yasudae]RHX95568.1 hypothetical protein DLM76_00805 [Leptospira yasudae]TGK27099.1 hypothetical protein EHQ05_09580 [Leptospira yasudae]TGM08107.1 hypothetical protein EHQ86_03590 [Leptospira yasudae]